MSVNGQCQNISKSLQSNSSCQLTLNEEHCVHHLKLLSLFISIFLNFCLEVRMSEGERVNIEVPRYDQSTYEGRAKHFFVITNPLNIFCGAKELEDAKQLVTLYRSVNISLSGY